MVDRLDPYAWALGIPQHDARICVHSTELNQLPKIQGVADLEVQVDVDAFKMTCERGFPPWKWDLNAQDVDRLEITKQIYSECKTLRRISITDGGCKPAGTDDEMTTWRNNLSRLEDMLQLRIDLRNSLPQQEPATLDTAESIPAYRGKSPCGFRVDSAQQTSLPLYAPESQTELSFPSCRVECDVLDSATNLERFWNDRSDLLSSEVPYRGSRSSLKALLECTGVLHRAGRLGAIAASDH